MTRGDPGFCGPPALVAAELRGYRRFRLTGAGLTPTVHTADGPWTAPLHHAGCRSAPHPAPATGCGCGLYGWYHPADARACYGGDVTAVIAARGRAVLGDSGFRAEAARVEAVAVPWWAGSGREARAVLRQRHPQTTVYRSRARMLRDHPPDDLSALGITVRRSAASRYGLAAGAVWAVGAVALYSVVVLPPGSVATAPPAVLLLALAAFVLWQGLLVHLVTRSAPGQSLSRQAPGAARWSTSRDASPV